MCGGGPKLPPATDPKAEREQADIEATQAANAKAAGTRRLRRQQSLLAGGATSPGNATTSSVLAIGKDKLGT